MTCLCCRCVADRFARNSGCCAFLRPVSMFSPVALTAHFEQKWLPRPLLLPGNRTIVCYNPSPRGTHGHTRPVESCKRQSCIRVRSAGGCCFRFVGDRLELNTHQTPKDVSICSAKNQSGAKKTLGKTQLDGSGGSTQAARLSGIEKKNGSGTESTLGEAELGSGGGTQTACLSSVEKENGSRTESTLGEGQGQTKDLRNFFLLVGTEARIVICEVAHLQLLIGHLKKSMRL
jgi:hypothetical protein